MCRIWPVQVQCWPPNPAPGADTAGWSVRESGRQHGRRIETDLPFGKSTSSTRQSPVVSDPLTRTARDDRSSSIGWWRHPSSSRSAPRYRRRRRPRRSHAVCCRLPGLNSARSRFLPSICNLVRIDQTWLGRRGGLGTRMTRGNRRA